MPAITTSGRPIARGARLRQLFDEAWEQTHRRRRRLAVVLLAAGALAGWAVASTTTSDRPSAPHPAPVADLALARSPYVGVACPTPNRIACDRVGVAIWLPQKPDQLVATLAGRSVALRVTERRCSSCAAFFTGYLQRAGLRGGALRVRPDRGTATWFGRHATITTLRLRAVYRDGRVARTQRRVTLRPGWG